MMASKKVLLKIIILGESGVGKTAILHKYVMGKFIEEHKATIGADFLTKDIQIKDKSITLQIWDTAGQERFQSLGNAFYRGADACVLVYDATNKGTFQKIQEWKDNFLDQCGTENPDKFPFLLLGNKIDQEDSIMVNKSEAQQWADNNDMIFYETSALNGTNIETALRKISDIASEMDTAPVFNTQLIDHEAFAEKLAGDDTQSADADSGSCGCELL